MSTKKSVTQKLVSSKKASATAPKASRPIKTLFNKTTLLAHVAEHSGVELKSVRLVMTALEEAITSSISKKGVGAFVMPGLLKITSLKVAAKPKRKGINPFTGLEQMFAAKPASVKIKVRPLKKLKDAVSA